MQARFVAHRELPDEPAGVGKFRPEFILAHTEWFTKKLVQFRLGPGAAAHQFKQSPQIMLHVPIVSVAVVFRRVIASALSAGKSRIVGFYPVAVGVLRPRVVLVLAKHILVIPRAFEERLVILIQLQVTRQLGGAPVVIALRFRDGHGLAAFTGMDLRHGFLFIGMQRRHVPVLVQKIIQRTFLPSAPRQPRPLKGIFLQARIGRGDVEIGDAFGPGIGHPGRGWIARHAFMVPPKHREARQPARLFIHADIGLELVGLHFRIQQGLQRFQRAVGVPQPVVHIERARVLVHLVVERTVVLAVFGDVDHALVAAVERCVENPALRGRAALDLDLAQDLIPPLLRGAFHLFKRPAGNLRL